MSEIDRIEKQIVLKAPRARVWRALTDHRQFGQWFGVELADPFVPGGTVRGRITEPPGYEHVPFILTVDRIEPERLMSWRWHPYATDPAVDYDSEPTTLVEFELAEVAGGTRLTVVESGFDGIPQSRRLDAFQRNGGGWEIQLRNIERHVLASL